MKITLIITLACTPLLADQQTFSVDRGVSINQAAPSSNSSSPFTFGRVNSIQQQALIDFDLSTIPDFARIDQVNIESRLDDGPFARCSILQRSWSTSSTWNSLGNGLSGNEIGSLVHVIPSSANTITISNIVNIREVIQSEVRGNPWHGLVYHATNNGSTYTNGLRDSTNITVMWTHPGDTDGDGDVDFSDFVTLANNYESGPEKSWEDGDFDGDGQVTFNDFTILANNYGWPGTPQQAPPI